MVILVSTYTRPLEEVDAHRDDHVAFVTRHHEAGRIVVFGRRSPPTGGVLICVGVDREEALAMVAEDPYVRAGVATYEPIAFTPSRVTPGLELLTR